VKKLLLLLSILFSSWGVSSAADPYYLYIHAKNPKLRPYQVAEIIAANRRSSTKYKANMYWHMCKMGHESGFKTEIGTAFTVGGRKYDNEPCYGIERMQLDVVAGMYPKMPLDKIKKALLNDYSFSIEAAYRLDHANRENAYNLGFKSEYQNRVVGLIIYNSGLGSWKKYHYSLGKYLKTGGKLEDLTLRDWTTYRLNFREVYSLNYYSGILTEACILNYWFEKAKESGVN